MIKLDPFSEDILFQCDHCQFVGEINTHIIEEDGVFYCWNCFSRVNNQNPRLVEIR
jgi:hypothetical protein